MSERINVKKHENTPALHLAIEALTSYNEAHPEKKIPIKPVGYLDVEFKVNGVEVPFAENIAEIYRRYEAQINKEAAKKAMDILSMGGLSERIYEFQQRFDRLSYDIKTFVCDKLGIQKNDVFDD